MHKINEERLRSKATDIKCARIPKESFGKKNYIQQRSIGDTRNQFRARLDLTDFAGNYTHSKKFAKTDWLCLMKVKFTSCQESARYIETSRKTLETLIKTTI